MYLVRGVHPTQGGSPTKATFDLDEANAAAAALVMILWQDVLSLATDGDGGDPIEAHDVAADAWQAKLADVQALAYAHEDGCTVEEAAAYLAPLSSDGAAQESHADVWIEEMAVDVPVPQPVKRIYFAAVDCQNGTLAVSADSEAGIERAVVEAGNGDYAAFLEFRKDYEPGEFDSGDLAAFMQSDAEGAPCDDLFTWSYEYRDVPQPEYGAAVALAQSIEDGWGAMYDDDSRWQNVSGGDAVEWLGGLVEDARKVLAGEKADPAELAIILEGGCVQNVTMRGGPEPRVFVVDYDTEGGDEEAIMGVMQDNGDIAEAYISEPAVDYAEADDDDFWRCLRKPETPEIECGQCEGTGTIEGGLGGDGDDEECPVCDGTGRIANPVFDEGEG